MARTSMSQLINLARDLIGDPASADQTFTDDQIERSLDVHCWEFRYYPLQPLPIVVSGNTEYREWMSESEYWESDAMLYDANYNQLTPASADPMHGRWSFVTSQISVVISGKVYDPYGAAADLLEMWAGRVAVEFDVDADGARMNRSQKGQALKELVALYRKKQGVLIGKQIRNDAY